MARRGRRLPPDSEAFGRALREERELAGLSQDALGELVGLSGARISQFESGAQPSPENVFQLEECLGVPFGRLSRHLGYVALQEGVAAHVIDVVSAIDSDPRLNAVGKGILRDAYRAGVRHSGG